MQSTITRTSCSMMPFAKSATVSTDTCIDISFVAANDKDKISGERALTPDISRSGIGRNPKFDQRDHFILKSWNPSTFSRMFRYITITAVLLLFINFGHAQIDSKSKIRRHKVGSTSGYGGSDLLDKKNSYDYRVRFIQLQYYFTVLEKRAFNLEIQIEPQFNQSYFVNSLDSNSQDEGHEFGINVGLLLRKYLFNRNLSFYFLLGAGPHYISAGPPRQATGFIFSDNIFTGTNIKVAKKLYLDVRVGFRHLSNAGLKRPNGGINNYVVSSGFVMEL